MSSQKETDSGSLSAKDNERKTIEQLGRLGFSIVDVATYLEVSVEDIAEQWKAKKGEIFNAWNKGRLQGQVDIRKTVMDAALNTSSPMIMRMLQEYDKSEQENLRIWEQ